MLRQQQASSSQASSTFAARCLPLACLDRTGMENWLRSWRGASGRRYICSVYTIGDSPAFDFERAIVAAVRKGDDGGSILFVFQPGQLAEGEGMRQWTETARRQGADEWHVHLLAETPEQRELALNDLSPRALALVA
jgi:hypothetical protein